MYSTKTGLILGFHGCDQTVADKIIAGKDSLKESKNEYDWLGHGIYFWENNPSRALDYAKFLKRNPGRSKSKIKKPSVLGAVIQTWLYVRPTRPRQFGTSKSCVSILIYFYSKVWYQFSK